jgi:hypothetical protein
MKYIIFLISLLLFSSCSEDFFESTITIPLPNPDPALAVTCFITDKSELIQSAVFLDTIKSPLKFSGTNEGVTGANVRIYRNDSLLPITYIEERGLYIFNEDISLYPGSKIRLEAEYKNFKKAVSEVVVPKSPIISKAIQRVADPFQSLKSIVSLVDNPSEENFYFIKIAERDTNGINYFDSSFELENEANEGDPISGESEPRNFFPFSNGYIFSDGFFSGKTIDLKIDHRLLTNRKFDYVIDVYSITKDYYFHELSKYRKRQTGENPFSEPVILSENIKNGHGGFGVGVKTRSVIRIR